MTRRIAIGGGRTVAQIANHGAAALHLLGADEVGPFNNAGPGFHQGGIFTELHARFTAPVFPGDELRIEHWPTGEFRTFARDRQVLVGSVRFSEVDGRRKFGRSGA